MVSPRTKEDMAMTTGNSDDVRMVPNPEPTCGIPIEYRRGGRTPPNMPSANPYGMIPTSTSKSNKNVGGNTINTVNTPPVERMALFKMGGVPFSTEPLKNTNAEKDDAASIPHRIPCHDNTMGSWNRILAAKTEPVRSKAMEISFVMVGFFLWITHSNKAPIQTNWNKITIAREALKVCRA